MSFSIVKDYSGDVVILVSNAKNLNLSLDLISNALGAALWVRCGSAEDIRRCSEDIRRRSIVPEALGTPRPPVNPLL
jgi:hypothetical protein